jgi:SOS response associated peptidase (SRAP)
MRAGRVIRSVMLGYALVCAILAIFLGELAFRPQRVPVILDPNNYDVWLDPGMRNLPAVSAVLKPCDARLMRCYPVSTRINHVVNDDEECSRPVEVAQSRLFAWHLIV